MICGVGAVREFAPSAQRRLGVLVDHLVAGSKESRIAATVRSPHVLITGHPFVDVWAGVRPKVLGLQEWPEVPRGQSWKHGLCEALGTDLATFDNFSVAVVPEAGNGTAGGCARFSPASRPRTSRRDH